jgi:hypothetical protein
MTGDVSQPSAAVLDQGAFTSRRTKALDLGFDTFVVAADNDEETLTTFITDVAPAVRKRVAEARAPSPREA